VTRALVVLGNFLPLAGAAWLGWSVLEILALYWVENLVALAFVLAAVAMLERRGAARPAARRVHNFLVLAVAASLFLGVLLALAAQFTGASQNWWRDPQLLWGVAALAAGHAAGFAEDVFGRRPSAATPDVVLARAVRRIPVSVFATVAGLFGLAAFGSPFAGLVVLVVVKSGFEAMLRTPRYASAKQE